MSFPTDGSDLLMVGTIQDSRDNVTGRLNTIRVNGYNYSEAVLGAIVFTNPLQKTPLEIIKEAIENANGKNTNFTITWDPANDTEASGLVFPTYSEKFFNKPLRQIVEKYSRAQYTNNGNFYWYVDENNVFVWRRETDSTNGLTYNYNTDATQAFKSAKDLKGVRNFFILKGGLDPAGNSIQTKFTDYSSVAKHGMKYQFVISEVNSAKNLIDQDIKNTYGTEAPIDSYPVITSSSFSTIWVSNYTYTVDGVSVTEGNVVTINKGSESANRSAYVAVIRQETILRLKDEGQTAASLLSNGKLKVDLTFPAGAKNWILGNNISCTIPKIAAGTKVLRVREIQNSTTTDVYSLEEDIGSV